jgi:hypothetical protein
MPETGAVAEPEPPTSEPDARARRRAGQQPRGPQSRLRAGPPLYPSVFRKDADPTSRIASHARRCSCRRTCFRHGESSRTRRRGAWNQRKATRARLKAHAARQLSALWPARRFGCFTADPAYAGVAPGLRAHVVVLVCRPTALSSIPAGSFPTARRPAGGAAVTRPEDHVVTRVASSSRTRSRPRSRLPVRCSRNFGGCGGSTIAKTSPWWMSASAAKKMWSRPA